MVILRLGLLLLAVLAISGGLLMLAAGALPRGALVLASSAAPLWLQNVVGLRGHDSLDDDAGGDRSRGR